MQFASLKPNPSADPALVIGTVAYDGIETPSASRDRVLGGSGAYASVAGSYFAPIRLSAMVGVDFEEADLQRLQTRNIDLKGLQKHPIEKSFYWKGKYHTNFNIRDTIQTDLNCLVYFEANIPDAHRDSRYVLLGNISPELQHRVLDSLTNPEFVLADTIVFWLDTQRQGFLDLLPRIHLLVINDSESEILTGERNIFLAGPKLREMGAPSVLIKKGEHGAVLFHEEGSFLFPAFPVARVVDPTGAGDAFAGALLGSIAAQGESNCLALRKALPYATAAASLTVEAFGLEGLETGGWQSMSERVALLHQMSAWA